MVSEQKERIRRQTSAFAEELAAIKSKTSIDAPKLSDTEIQARWRALGFAIRQFISGHLPQSLDHAAIQRLSSLRDSTTWPPGVAQTLQVPMLCPASLESWIWYFLYVRIFDSRSKAWAGETGKLWGALRDVVQSEWS